MSYAGNQTDTQKLRSAFIEKAAEVDESLVDIDALLEKLEDSNKILKSFAAFGAGFLAARIAISITRLLFGPDRKSNESFPIHRNTGKYLSCHKNSIELSRRLLTRHVR